MCNLYVIKHSTDLERLFNECADDLARFFQRRHAGRETERDLVQETFLEMARGLEKGKRPRNLRSYLFGIARNVSRAAWRRDGRASPTGGSIGIEEVAEPSPDDRIEAAREIIAQLPPRQREILDLRFNQDLSYAQIAEALDIPIGTVRSRLHHAVASVRDRLAEDDPPIENIS